jgi:NADPH-dependent 2,4-dienoyl-CoA reductase/sulfur reductase-like enzyme
MATAKHTHEETAQLRRMIDSLTRHPPGTVFEPDLCVIGAGPVGIAVAREFLDDTTRVLLLESGGESRAFADDTARLDRFERLLGAARLA